MLKWLPLRGLLVICGSAVALTVATLPAQAATTGWRAAATFSVSGKEAVVTGIDAVAANDAWAVGTTATSSGGKQAALIEHWAGKSWQRVTLPSKVAKAAASTDFFLSMITASSSANVWVFGEIPGTSGSDSYVRFNGKTWTTGDIPGTDFKADQFVQITAAVAVGKSDVWVLGGRTKISGTTETEVPYAAEFNGHSWSSKSVPGTGLITAASAVSASNIWAVTGGSDLGGTVGASSARLLHWNGTRWQAVATPPKLPSGSGLSAVLAEPSGDVWVAGVAPAKGGLETKAQFTDEWTGTSWDSAPTDLKDSASSSAAEPVSIVPAGSGLWALGTSLSSGVSKLWHYSGGAWSSPSSPKFGGTDATLLQLAAVPGTASVWAAGEVDLHKADVGLIGIDGPTPH